MTKFECSAKTILMTNNAQVDPVAIDTEIAELEGKISTLTYRTMRYTERERAVLRNEAGARPLNATEIAERDSLRAKIRELQTRVRPLHDTYTANPWNRWFWVQNAGGHLHTSMRCTTCFPSTRFCWVTERSGVSVEAIVAEYGTDVCTVCVPTAPVLPGWGTSKTQKEKAERKAARDAERAARQAKIAEKSLLEPVCDTHGFKVTTLAEARRLLTDYIADTSYGAHTIPNKDVVAQRRALIAPFVRAISAKSGIAVEVELLAHEAKARKKYAGGLRESIKNSGRWFGYYLEPGEAEAKLESIKAELAEFTGPTSAAKFDAVQADLLRLVGMEHLIAKAVA